MAEAQNRTIEQRINPELKQSMDQAVRSLDIDLNSFLNDPKKIQDERVEFVRNNPVEKPKNIEVFDMETLSSIDQAKIRMHCYQPTDFEPNRVILFFHGGGYIFGLPEQNDPQMFWLAENKKATIISVDYRLSPQNPFPVPIQDGFDALTWLIQHGPKELGIQADSITLYGASAGAHLAAAVSQMAVDKGITNIKQQFLLYPVIHNKLNTASMNEFTTTPLWNKQYAEIAWEHFLGKDNVHKSIRYADLTNFDRFAELPETIIVACELDPLRDEGISYALQLYQAGVKTELWVIPGALHVFDLFKSSLTDDYTDFLTKRMLP